MAEEFDLSKFIRKYIHEVTGEELRETLEVEDVKEFIFLLKKAVIHNSSEKQVVIKADKVISLINVLAGGKLR